MDEDDEMLKLHSECAMLSKLRHPHVVQFLGSTENDDGDFFLLLELASLGNLRKVLDGQMTGLGTATPPRLGGPLGWKVFFRISIGIVTGLQYLHANGVWHCDMKSLNVLMFDGMIAKITDFGLARAVRNSLSSSGASSSSSRHGTTRWMAPEHLDHRAHIDGGTDVYSTSVVIWEVLTGELPYKDIKHDTQVVDAIKQGVLLTLPEDSILRNISELLRQCWSKTQSSRPRPRDLVLALVAMRNLILKTEKEPASLTRLTAGIELEAIEGAIQGKYSKWSEQRILVEAVFKVSNPELEAKAAKHKTVRHFLHGTSKQAVNSILNDGFRQPTRAELSDLEADFKALVVDESTVEKEEDVDGEAMTATKVTSRPAGTLRFGEGIYFTSDVGKAAFFSEERGGTVLLVCNVALGRTLKVPAPDRTLTGEGIAARGYNSVTHVTGSSGQKHEEAVIYDPSRAVVKYVVLYRGARLQTVERQLLFEKRWASGINPQRKEKHAFGHETDSILQAIMQGTDKDQETGLDKLGSLCRDDCKVGARVLDRKDAFWGFVMRMLMQGTSDPLIWFCLRLVHNYAYENKDAQAVLQRHGGPRQLIRVLNSSNEAIVQKAAIAMCNMSQNCADAVAGQAGFECILALAKKFTAVSEQLTKVYIIAALRNFLTASADLERLEPDLNVVTATLPDIIATTSYKQKMWLRSTLDYLGNLIYCCNSQKREPDLGKLARDLSTVLQDLYCAPRSEEDTEVAWDTNALKSFYKFLIHGSNEVTLADGRNKQFWTTLAKNVMLYITEDGRSGHSPLFFASQALKRHIKVSGVAACAASVQGLPKAIAKLAAGQLKVRGSRPEMVRYYANKIALQMPVTCLAGTGLTTADLKSYEKPKAPSLGHTAGSIGD